MNHRSIGYRYDPESATCVFNDGVSYSVREMIYLAKADLPSKDEYALHMIKKAFDGEIDTYHNIPECKPTQNDWLAELGASFGVGGQKCR